MEIPAFFEPYRIPDSFVAEAYESSLPQDRAFIKTTFSLVDAIYGRRPFMREERILNPSSGIDYTIRRKAVDWVLILAASPFNAPVRLASAAMNACVAGIDSIFAVWEGELQDIPSDVLTTFDLLGLENLYAANADMCRKLLRKMQASKTSGRILFFGKPQCADQMIGNRSPLIRTWKDVNAPYFLSSGEKPAASMCEAVLQSHPDARFESVEGEPDAALGLPQDAEFHDVPLYLGDGLERVWFPPDLTPDFFFNVSMIVSQHQPQ
ncbi:MAG: hypothetical protein PUB69_04925 [Desulfovibrionaceae bacterium]|nr:hypothetical protein [Desulfovibrionaceae bacterium]